MNSVVWACLLRC